jgi:hypothetical protein
LPPTSYPSPWKLVLKGQALREPDQHWGNLGTSVATQLNLALRRLPGRRAPLIAS